jgi:hypothetical protein
LRICCSKFQPNNQSQRQKKEKKPEQKEEMATAYRTFLGKRVWPANILKVYWPFMASGSFAYFLFGSASVAMLNG